MELLLDQEKFDQLYNCQIYKPDEQVDNAHSNFFISFLLIVVWIIFQCLYLPCIKVIYIGRNRYACFQYMFYIGIMDILSLNISALFSSILQFNGWSFCSSPRLIYAIGCIHLGVWLTECAISVLLAICRCLEVFTPQRAEAIFGGLNGRIMVFCCGVYGFLGACYTKPQVYSSIYMSWLPNPHAGYSDNLKIEEYENSFYLVHNIVFIIVIILLYVIFAIISGIRLKRLKKTGKLKFNNAQKRSFVQVALIAAVNSAGATMCIYLQTNTPHECLSFLASFAWILAHGSSSIFYLTINKTIRNGCKRLLRRAQIHSIAIVPAEIMAKTSFEVEKSIANQRQRSV